MTPWDAVAGGYGVINGPEGGAVVPPTCIPWPLFGSAVFHVQTSSRVPEELAARLVGGGWG